MANVLAIQKWVTAVQDHVPGQRDAPVEMVSALTFDDRLQMNAGMGFFLSFLQRQTRVIRGPCPRSVSRIWPAPPWRFGAQRHS